MARKVPRRRPHGNKRPSRSREAKQLRLRVFEALARPENTAAASIADMQLHYDWVTTGKAPAGKPGLRVVHPHRDHVDRGQ